ncbi:metalloregulator ArsR/SmtB family transcription factor [Halomonas vilamensis]|uniref:Metalloregulator ArsR/SmtB family transcription factor n=1 Tax=Vreelandella vilamensis TaxID=531309 RepID=A0ABU1H388_9GAMM|nr:metalloregulator ArsR/SmtB family transcription factor [Halomonas vilamensis]MDR5898311.1 metalloregulator ArsR/SmtB family transcription factor [Halomonas vilamensis]
MPLPQSAAADLLAQNSHTIEKATALLKAMANEKRLQIVCLLLEKELSVTQINQQLSLSQSALSQHLAILRRDNLVNTRRESQTIYYSLTSNGAKAIVEALAAQFCR